MRAWHSSGDLAFLPIALLLLLLPAQYVQGLDGVDIEGGRPALILAGSVVAFIALIDIGLAIAVFAGRNWARLLLMLSCVVTTTGAFIGNANGSEAVTLATSLPTVGLSIMVLLALSSHRARAYASAGGTFPNALPVARMSRPLSERVALASHVRRDVQLYAFALGLRVCESLASELQAHDKVTLRSV